MDRCTVSSRLGLGVEEVGVEEGFDGAGAFEGGGSGAGGVEGGGGEVVVLGLGAVAKAPVDFPAKE